MQKQIFLKQHKLPWSAQSVNVLSVSAPQSTAAADRLYRYGQDGRQQTSLAPGKKWEYVELPLWTYDYCSCQE